MTLSDSEDKATRLNRRLTVWLLRVFALVLIAIGVQYWMRLIGFEPGATGRFDLMPVWWRIAAPALAVLYPVAGMGLWLTAGWGAVIWAIVALVEAMMHLGFPHLFGGDLRLLGVHVFGLTMLAILRLIAWRERRKARGY